MSRSSRDEKDGGIGRGKGVGSPTGGSRRTPPSRPIMPTRRVWGEPEGRQ